MTPQFALMKFGFKFGQSGAHSARSMMLEELRGYDKLTTFGLKSGNLVPILQANFGLVSANNQECRRIYRNFVAPVQHR